MLEDIRKSISSKLGNLFGKQATDEELSQLIRDLCTHLLQSNVSPRLVYELREELVREFEASHHAAGMNKARYLQEKISVSLQNLFGAPILERLPKGAESVVCFVGLQGAGKTTTVCKYAAFYSSKGYKVGIICADTFRAGAFDQVRQNALKIKVPFYGSIEKDPVVVVQAGYAKFHQAKFDIILVDTSGRHTQERMLFEEMQAVFRAIPITRTVLVVDAGIGQSCEVQAKGFMEAVPLGSVILTKMDGTSKAGGALSSISALKVPVEFIGTGEGMHDLERFEPKRFVGKLMGMGDIHGLMEKMEGKFDEKEMFDKIKANKFHLRDFYDQFQYIIGLGGLGKLADSIPGMQGMSLDENALRKCIFIFDSLCKKEMDSDGSIINESRILRIARGSGTHPRQVHDFINQFRTISGMMCKLGNMPGIGDLITKDPSQMSYAEKAKMKKQMKGLMGSKMFDQVSQMFQ